MAAQKRILVIGGTGAQGFAVVKALVEAKEPFIVRVLSRNPDSDHVKKSFKNYPQVELFKGSFMDFDSVERALQDCYGVFVNTDGESLASYIQLVPILLTHSRLHRQRTRRALGRRPHL